MERLPRITRLVQVAIRDYSRDEVTYSRALGDRTRCFYGRDLFRAKASGRPFDEMAKSIVGALPDKVYVSFDIDGLDPACCPSTGTPVPGGLSFDEAAHLLGLLADSGREIVGFDLCEVAPGREDE